MEMKTCVSKDPVGELLWENLRDLYRLIAAVDCSDEEADKGIRQLIDYITKENERIEKEYQEKFHKDHIKR